MAGVLDYLVRMIDAVVAPVAAAHDRRQDPAGGAASAHVATVQAGLRGGRRDAPAFDAAYASLWALLDLFAGGEQWRALGGRLLARTAAARQAEATAAARQAEATAAQQARR